MKKIGITTDCVCDLPEEYFLLNDVGVVYFYITTSTGRFRDGYEINSENLIEYLENGGEKAETNAPEPSEYKTFFEEHLNKYDEVIHISISDKVSLSYKNAAEASKAINDNGKKVYVVDSEHLSTGIGHIVVNAVDMRDAGCTAQEIIEECESLKKRVSTSFISRNADYLYRNGRVSKAVRDICNTFSVHPILTMKNGKMILKGVQVGNYDNSVKRYIRQELRNAKGIDKRRIFITHTVRSVKRLSEAKAEVNRICNFEEILLTKASATISSNCGEGTLGVLFIRK